MKIIATFLVTVLLHSNLFASANCLEFMTKTNLENLADSSVVPFEYATIWSSRRNVNPESKHQVNGFLVEVVTDLFLKNKALPLAEDIEAQFSTYFVDKKLKAFAKDIIEKGLSNYLLSDDTPSSIFEVLLVAKDARRRKFFEFKDELREDAMQFFLKRLRMPTLKELSEIKKLDETILSLFIPNPESFVEKAIALKPEVVESVQSTVLKVYFRALSQKDLEESQRTQPTSPTLESMFVSLRGIKNFPELQKDIENGLFTLGHLRELIGGPQEDQIALMTLSLFPTLKTLEALARRERPAAFKNFIPSEVYNPESNLALVNALKQKQGFLITSVNAGMPLNEAMYFSMLKYAGEKNYDIVIIPTGGILDGLDGRLLDHPRIHILTHTVQNKFLRLWNIPVLPKNQNGTASLNNPKQHSPLQITIAGHPTIQHFNVPTATNHERHTAIWTTGSLSQGFYPYRHAVQGRTSALAKNQHTNGFLAVERADGESGFDQEGVSNFWHPRPIYFTDDFSTESNSAGFTDNGVKYSVSESDKYNLKSVTKTVEGIETLVLGDLHERLSDPVFLKALTDFIKAHPEIEKIVLHDPIDGGSHNRHEARAIALLKRKFISGELDYHKEMMGLVQVVNALTNINPEVKILIVDSNHSYWGKQLLSGAPEFQEIANGKFLSEIRHEQDNYGFSDPIEYVFKYRNDKISRLPLTAQIEALKTAILVENPEQVIVLPFGKPYVVGPDHRPTHLNFHGHQGSNGARPSPKTHAIGTESAITGDSHQSYILGNWLSVGTSTPLRVGYNDGGYSAWSNSFATVYNDGSKQLFTYSSETQTFMARKDKQKMTESEFFGSEDLEVVPNDNDVVTGSIVDQNTHIIKALSDTGSTNRR